MGEVASLELYEVLKVDRKRLESLVTLLGDKAAERAVLCALDELGEALAEIEAAWRARDVRRILARAETLQTLSAELGMADLARVAGDVLATGRRGDPEGFASTVGRFARLIESALRLACGPCDQSV